MSNACIRLRDDTRRDSGRAVTTCSIYLESGGRCGQANPNPSKGLPVGRRSAIRAAGDERVTCASIFPHCASGTGYSSTGCDVCGGVSVRCDMRDARFGRRDRQRRHPTPRAEVSRVELSTCTPLVDYPIGQARCGRSTTGGPICPWLCRGASPSDRIVRKQSRRAAALPRGLASEPKQE
jgi:hypothetical protein